MLSKIELMINLTVVGNLEMPLFLACHRCVTAIIWVSQAMAFVVIGKRISGPSKYQQAQPQARSTMSAQPAAASYGVDYTKQH